MMKTKTAAIFIALFLSRLLSAAENETEKTNYIPLLTYEVTSLGKQDINTPGGGLVVQSRNALFVSFYKYTTLSSSPEFDTPDRFHSILAYADVKKDRNTFIAIFTSDSNRPVTGGYNTFLTGGAYGFQFLNNKSFSLTFGGGLYFSDIGVDLPPDNKPLLLFPAPLLRIKSETDIVTASFEFISGPDLNIAVFPKNHFRLTGSFRMEEYRDARDMYFDFALAYRFFSESHELGDFAGVSCGIKSDGYSFDLSDNAEPIGFQYYGLYGKIDLSLLQLSGGYSFAGIERHGDEYKKNIGDGYFATVQAAYQF